MLIAFYKFPFSSLFLRFFFCSSHHQIELRFIRSRKTNMFLYLTIFKPDHHRRYRIRISSPRLTGMKIKL